MTSSEIVPFSFSRQAKVALKDKPLKEIAETVLGGIQPEAAPQDFPEMPKPLEATAEIRKALKTLSTTFNKTLVTDRRTLSTEEVAALGEEYEAIQAVARLLSTREEQIKEIVRTHQDVEAEERGEAFPVDVKRNGNVVASATPRDAKGHYILSSKGQPNDLEIPGTTLKFSNQFSSGKVTENLGEITRMYEAGEIDEKAYREMTVVQRVPDSDKVRRYVLKTGEASILARIVKRGRDSQALYLRALKK